VSFSSTFYFLFPLFPPFVRFGFMDPFVKFEANGAAWCSYFSKAKGKDH
jgi:hypothetical protein